MKSANDFDFKQAGNGLLLVVEQKDLEEHERTDTEFALEITAALHQAYPGHPWGVSISGGALVLRHSQIHDAAMYKTGRNGFGYVLPPTKYSTRKEAVAAALKGGGELLETFRMPRGSWRADCPPIVPDWKRGKTAGFT